MVVNKCNITKYVIAKLKYLKLGISNSDSAPIIENYLSSLGCTDINICYPDDCSNKVISFTCKFLIFNISYNLVTNVLTFSVNEQDMIGGINPLSFSWTYSTAVFEATSSTNSNSITLKVKDGKILSLLTGWIKIEAEDSEGCVTEKSCYVVNGNLQCNFEGYVPCYSPSNLVVSSLVNQCPRPSSLIVQSVN